MGVKELRGEPVGERVGERVVEPQALEVLVGEEERHRLGLGEWETLALVQPLALPPRALLPVREAELQREAEGGAEPEGEAEGCGVEEMWVSEGEALGVEVGQEEREGLSEAETVGEVVVEREGEGESVFPDEAEYRDEGVCTQGEKVRRKLKRGVSEAEMVAVGGVGAAEALVVVD